MTYHLAIDIGASSGRHILGYTENSKLKSEEIYRFENNLKKDGETLIWDIDNLVNEVLNGLCECKKQGKIPETVSIDTWGVDYCLLDENKKEILPVVCYRDQRTEKIQNEFEKVLPFSTLYEKTGIAKNNFNTVYQLYCDKKSGKLDKAKHFLMIPEYLSFKLTGVIKNEYTNASTTALLNARDKNWDFEIIEKLGYPKELFKELSLPSERIGDFNKETENKVGFNSTVVFCPSHDTAAAVAACPLNENAVFISSGTWSLLGTENKEPILSDEARKAKFTNEGGIEYRFRFLQNIMGMWLLQNIRRNLDKKYSYDEMMNMAKQSNYEKTVDVNSKELVAPDNMIEAIRSLLGEEKLPIGDVLGCVYNSLALSYKKAVDFLEEITEKQFDEIFIVGGGSSDKYLNELTAKYTKKKVLTGLKEATATGNLISQLIYSGECKDLTEARDLIINSFNIKEK